jgi:chromatin segregation and condensation protein Rec8/ScpA/Scc1 (kleisin family)
MFEGRTRSEMVGLFLALLELVRNRRVRVAQDKVEGLITVSLRDEPEDQGHAAPETTAEADQAMPPA